MNNKIVKEYRIFTQEKVQPFTDGYKSIQLALKAFKKAKHEPSVAYIYEFIVDGDEAVVNKVGQYMSKSYVDSWSKNFLNVIGEPSTFKSGWELVGKS